MVLNTEKCRRFINADREFGFPAAIFKAHKAKKALTVYSVKAFFIFRSQ